MVIEKGTVVGLSKRGVWVETIRQSTCGSCAARKGCGQNLMNRFLGAQMHVEAIIAGDQQAELRQRLKAGDTVEIGIAENAILCGSLITYGLPVLCLVLAAVLGERLNPVLALPAALLGLAGGYLAARCILRYFFSAWDFEPKFLKQLTADQDREIVANKSD